MAHAQREEGSLKKHGDVMGRAIKDSDRQGMDGNGAGKNVDPIPMPDNGAHEKSHAAHLGGTVHDRTKPQVNLRQCSAPGELREPPQEISRVGKEHRKQ